MNITPHWTVYLSAFATPIIALIVTFIAYQQWRTAQNKLKLDLFDRRFLIYQAAHSFISLIEQHVSVTQDELYKFRADTRSAKWIMSPNIWNYFEELCNNAQNLQNIKAKLTCSSSASEKSAQQKEKDDLTKWFAEQHEKFDALCESTLRIII